MGELPLEEHYKECPIDLVLLQGNHVLQSGMREQIDLPTSVKHSFVRVNCSMYSRSYFWGIEIEPCTIILYKLINSEIIPIVINIRTSRIIAQHKRASP